MVRLLSPVDGSVLTTLVPPKRPSRLPPVSSATSRSSSASTIVEPEKFLHDAVYCLPLEVVFAAYSTGCLIKATTVTNPSRIKATWDFAGGMPFLFFLR